MISADVLTAFGDIVGSRHLLVDPDVRAPYEVDWSRRWSGEATAVVRPANVNEVSAVLSVCNRHRIACVPQGGRTGLVAGGVPYDGAIVVSLERLDSVGPADYDAGHLTVGAGVSLGVVQQTAARNGWEFGVDLAARDIATIGGVIATNAGGMRVVRHGQMRAQVLSLEVVLADGSVLPGSGLAVKDNAGYDISQLIVGTEGTLGIVTAATLKLVRALPERVAALIGVGSLAAALSLVGKLRRGSGGLDAAEFIQESAMDLVCRHLGRSCPIRRSRWYVLVECASDVDPTDAMVEAIESSAVPDEIAVAVDVSARQSLWQLREQLPEAIATLGIPHKLDVGLPFSKLDEFSEQAGPAVTAATSPSAQTFLFGHLGEGNVHVNVTGVSPEDERVDDAVLRLVARLGGNIASEHGVGRAKAPWLHLVRTSAEIRAMHSLKTALDPNWILNPGAVIPPADHHPLTATVASTEDGIGR
jgi:FAD/FMN-containing dehydrogenase